MYWALSVSQKMTYLSINITARERLRSGGAVISRDDIKLGHSELQHTSSLTPSLPEPTQHLTYLQLSRKANNILRNI